MWQRRQFLSFPHCKKKYKPIKSIYRKNQREREREREKERKKPKKTVKRKTEKTHTHRSEPDTGKLPKKMKIKIK